MVQYLLEMQLQWEISCITAWQKWCPISGGGQSSWSTNYLVQTRGPKHRGIRRCCWQRACVPPENHAAILHLLLHQLFSLQCVLDWSDKDQGMTSIEVYILWPSFLSFKTCFWLLPEWQTGLQTHEQQEKFGIRSRCTSDQKGWLRCCQIASWCIETDPSLRFPEMEPQWQVRSNMIWFTDICLSICSNLYQKVFHYEFSKFSKVLR